MILHVPMIPLLRRFRACLPYLVVLQLASRAVSIDVTKGMDIYLDSLILTSKSST